MLFFFFNDWRQILLDCWMIFNQLGISLSGSLVNGLQTDLNFRIKCVWCVLILDSVGVQFRIVSSTGWTTAPEPRGARESAAAGRRTTSAAARLGAEGRFSAANIWSADLQQRSRSNWCGHVLARSIPRIPRRRSTCINISSSFCTFTSVWSFTRCFICHRGPILFVYRLWNELPSN